jgi:hypothetical protein
MAGLNAYRQDPVCPEPVAGYPRIVPDPLHLSADDLAIDAAKEKLASLREHPGLADAMRPKPRGSRKPQVILAVLGAGLMALGVQACSDGSASVLTTLRGIVVIAVALLAWFLAIGASPAPPAVAWPAVVLAKPPGATVSERLVLLRDDGTTVRVGAVEPLYGILRPGDLGVAHVRNAGSAAEPAQLVIAFHRL